MQQYEQIVEDILTILSVDVDPTDQALRDVDQRYSVAVSDVNARLVACDKLLQHGHRAEAIQKCDAEPNLMDLVTILDRPEIPQWTEFVRQFGLPGPPAIRIEIAAEVNTAYNAESSLSELMRKHRLLALARAPLYKRLEVLRQIAKSDAGNPVWQQDVRSWEQVRRDQLPREVEEATARGDLKAVAGLAKEAASAAWLEPLPKPLVDRIHQAHGAIRAKQARQQLELLEKELTAAYSNLDSGRGRELRKRWEALATIGIQRPDDPLLELVAPALDWLTNQAQQEEAEETYQRALADLEAALDHGATHEELERLANAVIRCDRGELPEPLGARLQERLARLERRDQTRFRLILVGAGVALLAVAVGIVWGIVSHQRARELATHVANLRQLLEEKKYTPATDYLAELEQRAPRVHQAPEVQKLAQDVASAIEQNQKRRAHFERALADARRHGETYEGYPTALDALNDADKLVDNDAERSEAETARREVEGRRGELQKGMDEKFMTDFRDFADRCNKVDPKDLTRIEQLLTEGHALQKRPSVSSILQAQIVPHADRLKDLRRMELAGRSEAEVLERITDTVGDRSRFQAELEGYSTRFPEAQRTADFKRVVEEAGLWKSVEAWNNLVQNWSARDFLQVSAKDAAELIAEAETLLKDHPGFPGAENVRTLVTFLTAVKQRRDESGRSVVSTLVEDTLRSPVAGLQMVRTTTEARYYFKDKPPQKAGNSWSVYYLIDFGLEEAKRTLLRDDEIANAVNESDKTRDWTSPQRAFRDFALEKLTDLADQQWESRFFAVIRRLYDDPDMEPMLKVQLLARILEVACAGSQPLREAFGKHLELIQNAKLKEDANWIDPKNTEGQQTRMDAQTLLRRLEKPDEAVTRATALCASVRKPTIGNWHQWIGWLHRDMAGRWQCSLGSEKKPLSGDLFVIQAPASESPQLRKVGELTAGTPRLQMSGNAVEGRPVFLVERTAPIKR